MVGLVKFDMGMVSDMHAPESAGPVLPACEHEPRRYDGPSKAAVLAQRQQYCHPALFTYYREPLMIVEGWRQWLFDETGRRYLDGFAGIVTVSVGHCHPKVTARLREQIEQLQHTTTIYLHPNIGDYAEALAARMPEGSGLSNSYFVNSGSEANELAIQMARYYTGNYDVIALRNCYHGGSVMTQGLNSHYTWKFPQGQSHGVHHAIQPDPYRCPFEGSPEAIARKCAQDVLDLIRYSTPGRIAAFIAEPIQGVGGATSAANNYFGEVYDIVRAHGGICISDEVQTGFGRTGDHFWGFENFGVVPDVVTMAKGIGNGFPLGAVVTRPEIARSFTSRIHFNTFGGNPMACAVGRAVLDVIEEEGLQENARVVGGHLKAGLKELQERHEALGDVRGMGLMLGLDLVSDREGRTPDREAAIEVQEHARKLGLLVGRGGLEGNVIRLKPPLCVTREDGDFMIEVFDAALTRWEAMRGASRP